MIIRATHKLLKISGIKPVKNIAEMEDDLPGEWYAGLVSTGHPGKLAVHLIHNPTMINILILGKSLNKTLEQLPKRVENFLKRWGYSKLIQDFQLEANFQIYATNSRSMLGQMNQLKWNVEDHLAAATKEHREINLDYIEDIHSEYPFTINKQNFTIIGILDDLCNQKQHD